MFVKTDSEESAKKLLLHFEGFELEGRALSAEIISELEFFHRFPLVTPV